MPRMLNIFQHRATLRGVGTAASVAGVSTPSFQRLGPAEPDSPLVVSVPHAGRDYPPALLAALRVPPAALLPLEDRHVDALAYAALGRHVCVVARSPRAWIDLNRSEQERDPRIDDGARAVATPFQSARVRGGLGLIPRRASGAADIWAGRFTADDVAARIADIHRPYHLAVAQSLEAARERFGVAILLDLHSMPPLSGTPQVQVVVGDRFGRSAGSRYVARVEGTARDHRLAVARNTPYAGGYTLDRHGSPRKCVHALQVELDRSLYLDAAMLAPGPHFARTATMVSDMADALVDEALTQSIAAE